MSVLVFFRKENKNDEASLKPMTHNERNEDPKTASIILPAYLWEIIDRDAKRCRRSRNRQLEAMLVRYYSVESDVDLDETALSTAPEVVSSRPQLKKAG